MTKFPHRRDRFQRNCGNRPQIQARYYNSPANTSNFKSNEGQKGGLKRGQLGGNEKVIVAARNKVVETLKLNNRSLQSALICGKLHSRECRMGANVCYACGQECHFVKSCPYKRKERKPIRTQPRPNARVYSLSEDDGNAGLSTIVTGQFPVANLFLYTLINSGVAHSFIASKVVEKLECDRQILSYPFITITLTGDT